MAWGERIRRFRGLQRLTQEGLAELLGVDQATVSRWERGRQEPPLYVRRSVDKVLSSEFDRDLVAMHRVNTAPVLLALFTRAGRFLALSRQGRELTGLGDDWHNRSLVADGRPSMRRILRLMDRRGFFEGRIAHMEIVLRRPLLKTERYFELGVLHFAPELLADGEIVALATADFLSEAAPPIPRIRMVPMEDVGQDITTTTH